MTLMINNQSNNILQELGGIFLALHHHVIIKKKLPVLIFRCTNTEVNTKTMEIFAKFLRLNCSYIPKGSSFSFINCNIGCDQVEILARALRNRQILPENLTINLEKNMIGDKGFNALMKSLLTLQFTNLSINFTSNQIRADNLPILQRRLLVSSARGLKINLYLNQITLLGARNIISLLQYFPVNSSLDLKSNPFLYTPKAAVVMQGFPVSLPSSLRLDLGDTISIENLQHIIGGLPINLNEFILSSSSEQLTYQKPHFPISFFMYLRTRAITEREMSNLIKAVSKYKEGIKLSLTANLINENAMRIVIINLYRFERRFILDLSNSQSVTNFLTSLAKLTVDLNLPEELILDLSESYIDNSGALLIAQFLQHVPSTRDLKINLSKNKIDMNGFKAFNNSFSKDNLST